jgi:murein DD-endopeptidase MepM/ murein hydrolase activator NlpD
MFANGVNREIELPTEPAEAAPGLRPHRQRISKLRTGGFVLLQLFVGGALSLGGLVATSTPAAAQMAGWWTGDHAISQGYGCTSFSSEPPRASCPSQKPNWHSGIDIGMGCGTPLYAAAPVDVIAVGGSETGFGPYYPTLKLPDGHYVILGHVQQTVVTAGQHLVTGTLISYSGTLGNSTGCHLHFEVRTKATSGSDIDPTPYFYPSQGAVGSGAPTVTTTSGLQITFWNGPSNHLFESWYVESTGKWNGPVDVTASYFGGAAPLSSAPTATVTPDGSQQIVFWRGPSNHLYEAWYVTNPGQWHGPVDVTASYLGGAAPLSSAPSVAVSPDNATQLVFWQGPSNHLYEAWYATNPGQWHGPVDVTASYLGGADPLSSAPSVAVSHDNSSQIVFWQGPSNHLFEAWYVTNPGQWHGPADVTASYLGGAAPLSSAPSVAVSPDNATQLVFWQGPSNHLYEAWYATNPGQWHGPVDVTASYFGGAAPLSSSPSVAVTTDNSSQIVFWRGPSQLMYEAWYATNPGQWHGPVNKEWG